MNRMAKLEFLLPKMYNFSVWFIVIRLKAFENSYHWNGIAFFFLCRSFSLITKYHDLRHRSDVKIKNNLPFIRMRHSSSIHDTLIVETHQTDKTFFFSKWLIRTSNMQIVIQSQCNIKQSNCFQIPYKFIWLTC